MYSLHSKKENAHDESIWTCSWGRLLIEEDSGEKEKENVENENQRGSENENENLTCLLEIDCGSFY